MSGPTYESLFAEHVEFFDRPPFSESTDESFALKAVQEAAEFYAEPSFEEAVDVMICLIGWAHRSGATAGDPLDAMAAKLAKNQARTWARMPDGTLQHVTNGGAS